MESNTLQDLGLTLQLDFDLWHNRWRDPLRSLLEVEEISLQGLGTEAEQFNELGADLFAFYAALTQDFFPSAESVTPSLGAGSGLPVFQDCPPKGTENQTTYLQSTATHSGLRASNQHSEQQGKFLPEYLGDASLIGSIPIPEQSTPDYPSRRSIREPSPQKGEPSSSKREIQPSSLRKDRKVTSKLVHLRGEQESSIGDNTATEKSAANEPSRPMVTRRDTLAVEKGSLGEVNRPDFQSGTSSVKSFQNGLGSFAAPGTLRDLAALVEASPDAIAQHNSISTQPTRSDAGFQPATISDRKESLIGESSSVIEKGSLGEVNRPDFQSGTSSVKSFQNGLGSFAAPGTLQDLAALVEASPDAIAQHNSISTQPTRSDAGFQPTTIEFINEAEQHPESDPSFDLGTILDAVREEINQEYRRFYGS